MVVCKRIYFSYCVGNGRELVVGVVRKCHRISFEIFYFFDVFIGCAKRILEAFGVVGYDDGICCFFKCLSEAWEGGVSVSAIGKLGRSEFSVSYEDISLVVFGVIQIIRMVKFISGW